MGGLLEGRHAVTHHLGMDVLGATGAIPESARVIEDDGNLVSGGGVTSGLDVALYLVERELGPRIANAIERLFERSIEEGAVEQSVHMKFEQQSIFDGVWNTVIATPIGKCLWCLTCQGGCASRIES